GPGPGDGAPLACTERHVVPGAQPVADWARAALVDIAAVAATKPVVIKKYRGPARTAPSHLVIRQREGEYGTNLRLSAHARVHAQPMFQRCCVCLCARNAASRWSRHRVRAARRSALGASPHCSRMRATLASA